MDETTNKPVHYVLWVIQVLLALLFLFAGGAKLAMPIADLAKQTGMPGPFLQFISVVEILGGVGMIFPGLLHIKMGLTPLAAAGFVIIMIGATWLTGSTMGVKMAMLPFATGVFAAFVAYGRWKLAPFR